MNQFTFKQQNGCQKWLKNAQKTSVLLKVFKAIKRESQVFLHRMRREKKKSKKNLWIYNVQANKDYLSTKRDQDQIKKGFLME